MTKIISCLNLITKKYNLGNVFLLFRYVLVHVNNIILPIINLISTNTYFYEWQSFLFPNQWVYYLSILVIGVVVGQIYVNNKISILVTRKQSEEVKIFIA